MIKDDIIKETLNNCDELKRLLEQRNKVHGSYSSYTEVYSNVLSIVHNTLWENTELTDEQKRAIMVYLNNIINKIARIVTSDSVNKDNFIDIAGYSLLTMSSC